MSFVTKLIPNQPNRRSMVQWYFPPLVFPANDISPWVFRVEPEGCGFQIEWPLGIISFSFLRFKSWKRDLIWRPQNEVGYFVNFSSAVTCYQIARQYQISLTSRFSNFDPLTLFTNKGNLHVYSFLFIWKCISFCH